MKQVDKRSAYIAAWRARNRDKVRGYRLLKAVTTYHTCGESPNSAICVKTHSEGEA